MLDIQIPMFCPLISLQLENLHGKTKTVASILNQTYIAVEKAHTYCSAVKLLGIATHARIRSMVGKSWWRNLGHSK